jgi:hypothetical protein
MSYMHCTGVQMRRAGVGILLWQGWKHVLAACIEARGKCQPYVERVEASTSLIYRGECLRQVPALCAEAVAGLTYTKASTSLMYRGWRHALALYTGESVYNVLVRARLSVHQ